MLVNYASAAHWPIDPSRLDLVANRLNGMFNTLDDLFFGGQFILCFFHIFVGSQILVLEFFDFFINDLGHHGHRFAIMIMRMLGAST